MGGRACIRGLRITVAQLLSRVAEGATTEQLLIEYPDLEPEDIRQALIYARGLPANASSRRNTVRFLIDMNLSPVIASGLQSFGHDAVHAYPRCRAAHSQRPSCL
jgi:uncharacterized protein (DUF433 family)